MEDNFYNINNNLLVKYLLKETMPEEDLSVEKWLADNDDHRKFFEQLTVIWQESKNLQTYEPASEIEAWERFQQRIHATRGKVIKISGAARWNFLRVAAIFFMVIAGGWFTYHLSELPVPTLALNSQETSLRDTLSDGSVVTLNKHSAIRFPEKFTGDTRSVSLVGEAFFNISPDKKKPFIIHVNELTIKVVGTSFNIRGTGDSTEVIVETGVVEVSRSNNSISLKPKEKIVVHKQDRQLAKLPVTDKLYNYYLSTVFECDATPLWRLVEVLNQAYDSKIVISRKELKSLQLSTTFKNEPLDSILNIVSETFKLSLLKSGDSIIIK